MLKRVAFLGAIAALTIVKPSHSVAQGWDGWAGGGWGGCCGAVTVTVGFPRPVPFRRPIRCCERPFIPRPAFCCERPFIPRPVFCCERRFFPRQFVRPPYYYGDSFAPYAYNWNAGYDNAGYGDGYDGW
jgi:hypothetical protein